MKLIFAGTPEFAAQALQALLHAGYEVDEIKFRVVEKVAEIVAPRAREVIDVDGFRALFDGGWGLVRASNTQPVLVLRFEGRDAAAVERIREVMEGAVALARAEAGE